MLYRFPIFLVYRFHGDIDYLQNHIQPNLNTFPKRDVIFASIRSRGRLVKRELKMLGMVQKKLYRNTLTGGEVGGGGVLIIYVCTARLKGFVQSGSHNTFYQTKLSCLF